MKTDEDGAGKLLFQYNEDKILEKARSDLLHKTSNLSLKNISKKTQLNSANTIKKKT